MKSIKKYIDNHSIFMEIVCNLSDEVYEEVWNNVRIPFYYAVEAQAKDHIFPPLIKEVYTID